MTPKKFVHTYLPYAKQTEGKTDIDARFTLAQAALETGWGEHAPGNMFFGVKASTRIAEPLRQLLTTTEYFTDDKQGAKFPQVIRIEKVGKRFKYTVKDWFRRYDSPEESFTDHAQFFLDNKRYRNALEHRADPYKFAEGIAAAGYATDPNYAETLKSVVKSVEKWIE